MPEFTSEKRVREIFKDEYNFIRFPERLASMEEQNKAIQNLLEKLYQERANKTDIQRLDEKFNLIDTNIRNNTMFIRSLIITVLATTVTVILTYLIRRIT